jgi:DMSO reductase family type II enzyme heme b subunit
MKRTLAALAGMLATAAFAAPPEVAPLKEAGRLIEVGAAQGTPPLAPDDRAWARAPVARLTLYPQSAVSPGADRGEALATELRVLSGNGALAARLVFADRTEDRVSTAHTDRFADAAAIQLASRVGSTLPYVGMGEPGNPVTIWYWRAGGAAERLVAQGFGALERASGAAPEARAEFRDGRWTVVLRARLPAGASNPLPVSVAVWDGAGADRDGRKMLSAWMLAQVPGLAEAPARYRALAAEARIAGDASRGRALAAQRGCIACHRLPGAPETEIGPGLTHAGGLHWPGYLRRSIVAPSAFVVPAKGFGSTDAQGRAASTMPRLELPAQEVEDLVAYLASLR